jgi:hypothetical protein
MTWMTLYEQNNLVGVRIDKVSAAARVRWVLREPNRQLSGVRGWFFEP